MIKPETIDALRAFRDDKEITDPLKKELQEAYPELGRDALTYGKFLDFIVEQSRPIKEHLEEHEDEYLKEDSPLGRELPIEKYIIAINHFKRLADVLKNAGGHYTANELEEGELAYGKYVVENMAVVLDRTDSIEHVLLLSETLNKIAKDYEPVLATLEKKQEKPLQWDMDVPQAQDLHITARTDRRPVVPITRYLKGEDGYTYCLTIQANDINIKDGELYEVFWEAVKELPKEVRPEDKDEPIDLLLTRSAGGPFFLTYWVDGEEKKMPINYNKIEISRRQP
jgi:hypothetical protein